MLAECPSSSHRCIEMILRKKLTFGARISVAIETATYFHNEFRQNKADDMMSCRHFI